MHQIQFWLGLCPRPHWGSLQCSPDSLTGLKRSYFQEKGGEGKVKERGGSGIEGMEKRCKGLEEEGGEEEGQGKG